MYYMLSELVLLKVYIEACICKVVVLGGWLGSIDKLNISLIVIYNYRTR